MAPLLIDNLTFALIPRFLNPNKGVKNDLAKVEAFTDYRFGENPYASFSLGHYCEAYIDWGPLGSMLHLFVFGLLGAVLVGLTMNLRPEVHPVLVWSILFVVMTPWGTMQQDAITVLERSFWEHPLSADSLQADLHMDHSVYISGLILEYSDL